MLAVQFLHFPRIVKKSLVAFCKTSPQFSFNFSQTRNVFIYTRKPIFKPLSSSHTYYNSKARWPTFYSPSPPFQTNSTINLSMNLLLLVREPLWACCWNSLDSNKFVCGSQKGTVYIFDRRFMTSDPERVIELPDSKTGIISLCSLPPRAGRFMPLGGILACRLV